MTEKNRRKWHLLCTCLGYEAWGFGLAIQLTGIKAGWGLYPTIFTYGGCMIAFVLVMLTSLEEVKKLLFPPDTPKEGESDLLTPKDKAKAENR